MVHREIFTITDLLKLVEKKGKYEITDAAFALIDKVDRMEVPKKIKDNKVPVQVMHMLSSGAIQYGFVENKGNANEVLDPTAAEARLRSLNSESPINP